MSWSLPLAEEFGKRRWRWAWTYITNLCSSWGFLRQGWPIVCYYCALTVSLGKDIYTWEEIWRWKFYANSPCVKVLLKSILPVKWGGGSWSKQSSLDVGDYWLAMEEWIFAIWKRNLPWLFWVMLWFICCIWSKLKSLNVGDYWLAMEKCIFAIWRCNLPWLFWVMLSDWCLLCTCTWCNLYMGCYNARNYFVWGLILQ